MAEQQLNRTDVCASFQEVDGERVAQRMGRDRLGNAAASMGLPAGLVHGVGGDRVPWPLAGKSQGRGRLTRHHSRKISSSFGDSITSRSF